MRKESPKDLPKELMTRPGKVATLSSPETWLGQVIASYSDLSSVIDSILTRLEDSVYLSSLSQIGGKHGVLQDLSKDLEDKEIQNQMKNVYSKLLERLKEKDIEFSSLQIVSAVCVGGIPFPHFGLHPSKTVEECAEHHVKMAMAIASILVTRLRYRDSGSCKVDGIMFACKGTLPVALCIDEYCLGNIPPANPVTILGFGTDLLQGFIPENYEDSSEKMEKLGQFLKVIVFNTMHDTAVGAGRANLDQFISRINEGAERENKAIWLDELPDLDHNWYDRVLSTTSPDEELRKRIFESFLHSQS